MKTYYARSGSILALLGMALCVGCGYVGEWKLQRMRQELRTKFAEILDCTLDGRTLDLQPVDDGTGKLVDQGEVVIGDIVVRLPRFERERPRHNEETRVLEYPRFKVMVQSYPENELPVEWGPTNFDRYRAVYGLGYQQVDAVRTPAELAHVATGITLKSLLVVVGAKERFTEFRTNSLHGFLIGHFEAGSRAVFCECYTNVDENRKTTIAFMPEETIKVSDAELMQFISAVAIMPAVSDGIDRTDAGPEPSDD